MSFLFKKKNEKTQSQAPPPTGLPPASRNLHTSDGTAGPVKPIGTTTEERKSPPPGGANGSLSSLNDKSIPHPGPAPFARRDRAGSELGPRPQTAQMRPAPHADLYPWSQRQLSFTNANANPFPRYGAAVNSIASKDGDIYLMGGLINGESVRGDLWMVEGTGQMSCYPITTVAEGPGPRVGHSSLLVGNAFIVFGGDTQQEDNDILDDTLYLLNTTSRQWSRASPPGPRPAGRYGHTLNIVGSKIYIFGGQVEGTFYNDLVAFDLNALQNPSNQWDFLVPNQSGNSIPPARTNHTMISHGDSLYLFGGTDGQQWFNDVWCYEPKPNKWTQLDCIGYIPAPREGHSAALVNDVMYIFGGRTEHGDDLGDLAAFRISLRRWYTFQNMGPSPSPRSGHSMTAFGKQIIVVAGEPSTAPRDPAELSMAYILDTAKIRYPNDAPASQIKSDKPLSPTRQISDPSRSIAAARSGSREENGRGPSPKDQVVNGGPVRFDTAPKFPRASMPAAPTGPPPQMQAPNPRMNGAGPPQVTQPMKPRPLGQPEVASRGASLDQPRPTGIDGLTAAPVAAIAQSNQLPPRTDSQEGNRQVNREQSPSSGTRRTPSASKAKAMEAGEAAPLVGAAVARQRSQRSQRAHSSVDGSEEGILRTSSGRSHGEHRHSKSFAEEPHSPNITPHHEALMKELDAVKSRNAWYASELALARKSGYAPSASPTLDERATLNFGDEDRPLVEAFMNMRSELMKMQQNMEQQSKQTAQRIAEVEHQRDSAVTEAAYARAKLAAHGGSARSTPQIGSQRDSDEAERSTDISRRLALSLAATNEHKAKLETLSVELEAERKSRAAAEEAAEAYHNRLEEMSRLRNPGEIDALRAELHETQSHARGEAGRRSELEQKLRMLEVDHRELQDRHTDVSGQVSGHISSLAALEAAVAASTSKASMFERQLDEERQARSSVEAKLAALRSEHETQTQELESLGRKHRDAEELAESHAREANAHREALMTGLSKISRPDSSLSRGVDNDGRIAALQAAAEEANKLAKANEEAAELAAQKLRSAEERIAGLEAYQEQSSREGLGTRRQLQAALRDLKTHENNNRDLRSRLETHQRDALALAVQHGALKDLLGERGVDMNARRSPGFDGSRNGTPDLARARELEQQLHAAQRLHDETRAHYEAREQEAEKGYREKLEPLENDYQSLLTYVRGTEKMLKKMKEELTRHKSSNQKLQAEMEAMKDGTRSAGSNHTDAAEWASERDAMSHAIHEMKAQMAGQIQLLEQNMALVQGDLEKAQKERDMQKAQHLELTAKNQKELTELKNENSMLSERASDAEHRVAMLLDQVGSSVTNYRRQSQQVVPNGARAMSPSTATDSEVGDDETRGSVALDNLASELETLKLQWETQSKSYRLSDRFDFERTPTRNSTEHGLGVSGWQGQHDTDRTPTSERTPVVGSATAGPSSAANAAAAAVKH